MGVDDEYRGHARLAELWHASTEAWEWLSIEAWRTAEFIAFPSFEEAREAAERAAGN